MDNPGESIPERTIIENGSYTVAAISADAETKGMEVEFAGAQSALKQGDRDRADLREQIQQASAVLDYADEQVDGGVEAFELALLSHVGKKRDQPKYVLYFPNGLRDVTQADKEEEEPEKVQELLDKMAVELLKPETVGEYRDLLMAHQTRISERLSAVKTAITSVGAVEDAYDHLDKVVIPSLRQAWIEKRVKLYGALTQKFPGDKARVERYFKRFNRRRTKAAEKPPAASGKGGEG